MDDTPPGRPLEPARGKAALRRRLQAERQALADRDVRALRLDHVLRTWLAGRHERTIGAYWPIRAEFDALPTLSGWRSEDPARRIGLPVIDGATKRLGFREWYPGCPMDDDAFGIPTPSGTGAIVPQLLLVPCVGFGPSGVRLGYGGGYYDRTLPTLQPRPATAGIGFAHGYVHWLEREPHDVPLDVMLTEDGVAWQLEA